VISRKDAFVKSIKNKDVYKYMRENNYIRLKCLAGVCITWFLLDLTVFGLDLDRPKAISTMHLSSPRTSSIPCNETWRVDPAQPNIAVYNMLEQDSI
jgi:hypothetical protein